MAKDRKGEITRRSGLTHWAAILVLSAIPAIVLSIFDAPVVASDAEQSLRTGLLGPIRGYRKAGIVGFFDHLALAHFLSVAVEAHDLGHPG